MSVAKVSEMALRQPAVSKDAIAGARAGPQDDRNIKSLWIKEQHARVVDGKISEYQVNMLVTTLDD
jgi:flavin-binding protein dodecin